MDITGAIENMAAHEPRAPKDGESYIGEDGLLYCARCGRRLTIRKLIDGKQRTVSVICDCEKARQEAEDREAKEHKKMQAVRRYREMGFPDSKLKACTFATDDRKTPKLSDAMQTYVQHFDELRNRGSGLLLYGDMGTGKTFYAACIVNALIDQGRPCLMTNFSRLTNIIGATWEKQEKLDSLTKFELVAIDDLGVERDTEYMTESVTTIIDGLYRAKIPLIVTSNYSPRELQGEKDPRRGRIYDRLLECCHPVKVSGGSRRKATGRSNYDPMNHLLGLE